MKTNFRFTLLVLSLVSTVVVKAQVPKLSSFPASPAVIFLDFDGQTVAGTSWNSTGPILCGPAGFNNAQITEIFNRVSEDYRPFNVNITTDSSVYFAAPLNSRVRCIVTVTSSWYGSAGGVSFIGSFIWGDDTPCFVFSALLNYNVKMVAEACSHEVGHSLGLYHQSSYDANCVKTNDYNYGQGSGEIGWAPIMGAGYYQNMTLWNNGPNSFGCASYQNDLDIITNSNGFSYRTDDYSNNFAGAPLSSFNANSFVVNGVIEKNTDQDYIKFIQPTEGRLQLSATPYNVGTGDAGSNLDMQVTLFKSDQTPISIYNPGTLLSSFIDTTLNPGTYYLKIEGKGNAYAPNYASLGSYSLRADFSNGVPLPIRNIELRGQVSNDRHLLDWTIDADEQINAIVVESSLDGKAFSNLATEETGDRAFAYEPASENTILYRLNVTFENGRRAYSNTIALRTGEPITRPKLLGNLVSGSSISVSSPGNFDYSIHDIQGRTIGHGQLTIGVNVINTAFMTNGMYLIRFNNENQVWTDKMIRQ